MMKKTYETPVAEKIEFCYEDQVVASSGENCIAYILTGSGSCPYENQIPIKYNN